MEKAMTGKDHWNAIFSSKQDAQLGWYEKDASRTLAFVESLLQGGPFTIFVPGAGTSLLVDELLARKHALILNDISDVALQRLKGRIGDRAQVVWLCHDIARPLPACTPQAELWIDRAVLHFLLDEGDIEGYFRNLDATVKPGGWVLLAEFSQAGAPKCAGLDVHRYTVEEMTARLGAAYELVRAEDHLYRTPNGDPRPYVYALYRKVGGCEKGEVSQ